MRLIVLRGLPGSGKTTQAKAWVATDPRNRIRVNKDDLRAMAHDSTFIAADADTEGTERAIRLAVQAMVSTMLKRNVDVIVDDTNLPSRQVRDLRRLAVLAGAEFEVWDFSNMDLETCLERNRGRADKDPVPDDDIRDMYRRYIRDRSYPLPIAAESVFETGDLVPYERPAPGTPTAYLVDLDGTLRIMGTRDPYDSSRVGEDRPNVEVIRVIEKLHEAGHEIIIWSASKEQSRMQADMWLHHHVNVSPVLILFRADEDVRADVEVKYDMFNQHIRDKWNILGAFDDRDQVVEMLRNIGLTVFQVAEGKF